VPANQNADLDNSERADAACDDSVDAAMERERVKTRARRYGLEVVWEVDDLPWAGDCEAPPVVACAFVAHPDDDSCGYLACQGGIGLTSRTDPYMAEVEAGLLDQAVDELEAELDPGPTLPPATAWTRLMAVDEY
jgi:hypothetical protein